LPFTIGLVFGAATTSTILWLVGAVLAEIIEPRVRAGGIVVISIVLALHHLQAIRVPLPQNARLVPQDILAKGRSRAALQFGYELGTGVRTYVTSVVPYLVAAAVLLLALPLEAAMFVALGFALGRALVPVGWVFSGGQHWTNRFQAASRWMNGAALVAAVFAVARMATLPF